MAKTNHFDIRDLIKASPDSSMYYIVGQGGVGKSYSSKKLVITEYLESKSKFVYIRNVTTETSASFLLDVFSDVERDPEIPWDKIDPEKKYHCFHILPKSHHFCIVGEKLDGSLVWLDQIGRIVALSMAQRFKGGAYNTTHTIFFDEFIAEGKPDPKMADNFSKIINTVGRSCNKELKVICCGNPDYSIELNPLLAGLHLDYARLQDNTAYYYDSIDDDGRRIANNVCFFKIANWRGEFLNRKTSHLFGSAEELMRATGAVKSNNYIHIDDLKTFRPYYCLIVETPIIATGEYRRKLYATYGEMYNEPVLVCTNHYDYTEVPSLYCRYDATDFRPRPIPQTYRINIPNDPKYKELRAIMAYVDANRLIISNDDRTATVYEQIRENS